MSFNRIIILKGQCHDIKNSFNQVGGIDLQKGGRKYRKNISAIECYKDTRKKGQIKNAEFRRNLDELNQELRQTQFVLVQVDTFISALGMKCMFSAHCDN